MEKNSMYPMFVDLTDKPVLVVGGGKVASRKVESLLQAGASVTVVTLEAEEKISAMANAGKLNLIKGTFQESQLDNIWLVIASTDDSKVNRQVFEACEQRRIFCNVVDVPEFCRFHVPARVQRGGLQIAISTSGKSPALAKQIKKDLSEKYGTEYEEKLEVLNYIRNRIKELKPICQCNRAELNQKVLEDKKAASLTMDNTAEIESYIKQLLDG